jgi:hypothetical protein
MSSAARKAWATRKRHGSGPHKRLNPDGTWGARHEPKKHGRKRSKKLWIQEAVKRPGALRATVSKAYGKEGFDSKGRIKVEVLKELRHSTKPRVRQQAQFALNVKGLGK